MTAFFWKWTLASTLLIAAVLLLRAIFGRRISARLRYALWAAVLLRLLVPVQLFTAPVETPRVLSEAMTVPASFGAQRLPARQAQPSPGGEAGFPIQAASTPAEGESAPDERALRESADPTALLAVVWLSGAAAMAAAFLVSNISFARKLRRLRAPLEADCPLPVYRLTGLPSPCLFGVLRPAVYVTPEAAADPAALRHVLTHETTHFRHGDHLWSLLRCAALAVHWWNPLVWLAAVLSRRDAELACDEGALEILGDGERRAYGGTLLALVTAKPRPGDLLRCATTMTGNKRNLRERIGRIAHAPKRWLWAAALSAALAALVCACSFAKTKTPGAPGDGPLTANELYIFNRQSFNGDGFNILNQFLFLAAETPKDYEQIDLFQLFYNGTGKPVEITEAERRAVAEAGYHGQDPGVDLIKCPSDQMDEVLREFLGLGLEETEKRGLDRFTYLPEYDAYYDFHGDTNYPGKITFLSGQRSGGTVFLYYEADGFPVLIDKSNAWISWTGPTTFCLELEEQEDGWFQFRSNWPCFFPAAPTCYPDGAPELVIPLDGLEPYEPEAVTVTRHSGDVAESLYRTRFEPHEPDSDGFDVEVYRSASGSLHAAVVVSETERDCFLLFPDNGRGWKAEPFTNLFGLPGCNGVVFSYSRPVSEGHYGEFRDYFTFSKEGVPSRLLQAEGLPERVDLDGDGVLELTVCGQRARQIFFQRNGRLYAADIPSLVQAAWPEASYMDFTFWDTETRSLGVHAQVPFPGGSGLTATAFRTLWFDGETLRLYKDRSVCSDHVKMGLDAPADVLAAARDLVQRAYELQSAENEADFDDWVVTMLQGPYRETAGPVQVEIWRLGYELHTTTPEKLILAGGSYLTEDSWCMIGYPFCDSLYFQLHEDGSRTYLYTRMENDVRFGSETFWTDMVYDLREHGVLSFADLNPEEGLALLNFQPSAFLNFLGDQAPEWEREQTLARLALSVSENPKELEYAGEPLNGSVSDGLTAGGRAAWEELQRLISAGKGKAIDALGEGERKEIAEVMEPATGMSLPELFRFYQKTEAPYSIAVMGELLKHIQSDPAAVLSALAEWETGAQIAEDLGASLYWNESFVPGALERLQALSLDGEKAAMRDQIVSAYAAKQREETA